MTKKKTQQITLLQFLNFYRRLETIITLFVAIFFLDDMIQQQYIYGFVKNTFEIVLKY